jgi:hypothetical protein
MNRRVNAPCAANLHRVKKYPHLEKAAPVVHVLLQNLPEVKSIKAVGLKK